MLLLLLLNTGVCLFSSYVTVSMRRGAAGAPPALNIFKDPVKYQRITLENLLDTLNIQGPKPIAVLTAIVSAALADGAGAEERMVAAAMAALATQGEEPDAATVRRHISLALSGITPSLLQALLRLIAIFPTWRPATDGRVDNPPLLGHASSDAKLSFSQEDMHRVRHLVYCHLPLWTSSETVTQMRQQLFAKPPSGSTPCALITVGPVGGGKSWVLRGSGSPIHSIIARELSGVFPAPALSSFAAIDPDSVLHSLCGGIGREINPALRPYANFVNHENFCCGLALRHHLIFDGSGRDPTNICGRVIARLRPAVSGQRGRTPSRCVRELRSHRARACLLLAAVALGRLEACIGSNLISPARATGCSSSSFCAAFKRRGDGQPLGRPRRGVRQQRASLGSSTSRCRQRCLSTCEAAAGLRTAFSSSRMRPTVARQSSHTS